MAFDGMLFYLGHRQVGALARKNGFAILDNSRAPHSSSLGSDTALTGVLVVSKCIIVVCPISKLT